MVQRHRALFFKAAKRGDALAQTGPSTPTQAELEPLRWDSHGAPRFIDENVKRGVHPQ